MNKKTPEDRLQKKLFYLEQSLICKNFTQDELTDFAEICMLMQLDKDTVLFHQGDKYECEGKDFSCTNFFYIMGSGNIKLSKQLLEENEKKELVTRDILIGILRDGESFGEIAMLFDERTRTATAVTLTDTVLLAVCRNDFLAYYKKNRKMVENLLMISINWLKQSNVQTGFTLLSSRKTLYRVMYLIDYLKNKYRKKGETGNLYYTIELPFTVQQMSEFASMSQQKFSPNKKSLIDQGLIESHGRTIVIPDYQKFSKAMNG